MHPLQRIILIGLLAAAVTIPPGMGLADTESPPPPDAAKQAPAEPAPKQLRLPEPMDAAALHSLITAHAGTFDLVDIRPPDQYADYHIPGSRNVPVSELLSNPDVLKGTIPLILIDRDDTQAMAVGGILCQKTERPIRVLSGGLEAYWTAIDRKPGGQMPAASQPAVQPSTPQSAPAPPAAPTPPAKPPVSAGC